MHKRVIFSLAFWKYWPGFETDFARTQNRKHAILFLYAHAQSVTLMSSLNIFLAGEKWKREKKKTTEAK
jgi:hypothetical protein